jgi:hypothetical protein
METQSGNWANSRIKARHTLSCVRYAVRSAEPRECLFNDFEVLVLCTIIGRGDGFKGVKGVIHQRFFINKMGNIDIVLASSEI